MSQKTMLPQQPKTEANENDSDALLRLLKRAVGPLGGPARKLLTENQKPGAKARGVSLTFYGKKSYQLMIADGFVCAMNGSVVECKVPFVPWDEDDAEYELVMSQYEDPVTHEVIVPFISDELLARLSSRFDSSIW